MLLHQAVSAGAVSDGADAGRALYQAAGTGETSSGRSVGRGQMRPAPKQTPGPSWARHCTICRSSGPIYYLEDGRLELSSNRAERSIKPFVMDRKSWLFSNTPTGTQSSAVIHSLIETAKENGLDPYRYLVWLLNNAPGLSQTDKAQPEFFLPVNAPQECKIPTS